MPINLIAEDDTEPITIDQAKVALRMVDADPIEDDYIRGLIKTARQVVESKTGRALINQTWQASFDRFPRSRVIYLERAAPLISIDSVQYLDPSVQTVTLDPGNYRASTLSRPGRLILGYGKVWPITAPEADAVIVEYESGYSDVSKIPAPLINAIYYLLAHFYRNREPVITGLRAAAIEVPGTLDLTLDPYRVSIPKGH